MFENLRKKETFLEIWQKRDNRENLPPEENRILKVMEEHEEYHAVFNSANVYELLNKKTGQDPFFHVTIHSILEKQMEENNPPEVLSALDHLMAKDISRHKALHSIALILADEIYDMIRNKKGFNHEGYSRRLSGFLTL